MYRRIIICLAVCIGFTTLTALAGEPNDYIIPGRALLFDGTLSGIRGAYQIFDDALSSGNCPECVTNKEFTFFHCLADTAMLLVRDDGNSIDSIFELGQKFGITISGDHWAPYFEPDTLDANEVRNQRNTYQIPQNAPDINDFRNILDSSFIPEIEEIIEDLNSISDTPSDRFRIYLTTDELKIFYPADYEFEQPLEPVEVDYGEVLLLKGFLTGLKAQLEMKSAYDIYVEPNDRLFERDYGNSLRYNEDVLLKHPEILKVLPTVHDSNNGKAILAQAAQDLIDSLNYYLAAAEYIRSEEDWQGDDFLYIDPNDDYIVTQVENRLTALRDSRINDTVATMPMETIKTYSLQDACSTPWTLILAYDTIGYPQEQPQGFATPDENKPTPWDIPYFNITEGVLTVEMDFAQQYDGAENLGGVDSVLFVPSGSNYSYSLADSMFNWTGDYQSGWSGDNVSWNYVLPFSFPFYGTSYNSVNICSNGFLDFVSTSTEYNNTSQELINNVRIAPLWDDLYTDSIYIDQTIPGEIKFLWSGYNIPAMNWCCFSVTLFSDGRIRFDYYPDSYTNSNLTPTVGISGGSSNYRFVNPWSGGLLTADISEDGNTITNGVFEYWGSESGTLNNFSGQMVSIEIEDANIDLNPVFGSTARYPNPVNPRDLLPEFDQWNEALPGTVGHGLENDPTLGGILPQMTQYDWQKEYELQPSGLVYLDYINNPARITIDGDISDWDANQLIFNNISGNTDKDSNEFSGIDIKNLYMAYDQQDLYGAIELYDDIDSNGHYYYDLFLSYSPHDSYSWHSLKVEIMTSSGGYVYGELYYMSAEYGWTGWHYVSSFTSALGQRAVEFKIPFDDIPDYLPGRFITVESKGWDAAWYKSDREEDSTHLRIGEVGTISGTVSYNGFTGDPIFVQAYTDPEEPEESEVATVMITQPGPYTLEGIGYGWEGYVRAFTPVFGFENPFEINAFQVQTSTPVWLGLGSLEDVDITMNYPIELKKDIVRDGEIDSETREVDWYYFDAVAGGTYTINLTPGTALYACMALYDRNARWELIGLDYWETQQIIWTCPASGRYYIEVSNGYDEPAGGTYQIQMTSDITCPQADIANAQWVGVKDCIVNFYDLAAFASQWLDSCSEPFWCEQADFNTSGSVNFSDLATLTDEWLQEGM